MLDDVEVDRIDELIRAETPELLERQRRRKAAIAENTLSGQLRRAVIASGLRYRDLSRAAGLSAKQIDDFMTGDSVSVQTADAIAAAIKCQLTTAK